jgi:hypothetical protein
VPKNTYELTFETKCWENDWEYILKTDRLRKAIDYNKFNFKEKVLYINNVKDINQVKSYADKLVNKNILTSYVVVDDYAEEALTFFGLTKEDFKGGYYYSIQELVGIYLCKTEYLLHFSGDASLVIPIDWIDKALKKMNSDEKIKVACLTWNNCYEAAKRESYGEDENFYLAQGFSDQNYLIKVSDFKNKIYNEINPISQRYPVYGGELFEKRVDSYMRNNGLYRIIFKHGSYLHKNIEPSDLQNANNPKKIFQFMEYYLKSKMPFSPNPIRKPRQFVFYLYNNLMSKKFK